MKYVLFLWVILIAMIPDIAESRIGVGVGTSKIEITEILMPGEIYNLPPLTVINTGDEVADYGVGISYHEQQPEIMPPESWFIFSPSKFTLQPGQSQPVSIKLNIPIRTTPGDYFAYIEAHPIVSASGQTRINIASAAKIYFRIGTSNLVAAVYYKAASFWNAYNPWTSRIAIAMLIIGSIFIFKKFFKVQVNFKK